MKAGIIKVEQLILEIRWRKFRISLELHSNIAAL